MPPPELGEAILREAGDYCDRGIAAADHAGRGDVERLTGALFERIEPTESWLLRARTNWLANRLASRVRSLGISWQPTRGHGGWNRPMKNKAFNALFEGQQTCRSCRRNGPRYSRSCRRSSTASNCSHGVRRRTSTGPPRGAYPAQLTDWGATPALVARILDGSWATLIDGGVEYSAARNRWSYEAVIDSRVRVGTIHSVKGPEADNVLWLTTTTRANARTREESAGFDEECRVSYLAATRARRRLIVAVEPNQRNRFKARA